MTEPGFKRGYAEGYAEGYAAAIKEVQVKFMPLWQAVQQAVGRSHALDSFIIEKRKDAEGPDHVGRGPGDS